MKLLFVIGMVFMAMLYGGNKVLKVGDQAPDFKLLDQNGDSHTLSDYRGQKVVVYFYPKDDTPGCTKEACGIRDHYSEFDKAKIKVFGISYDDVKSHRKFQDKYNLPFTLLADTDKSVSKLYGTSGLIFASRETFLIDEKGIIVKIYPKVSVTEHAEEILKDFTNL